MVVEKLKKGVHKIVSMRQKVLSHPTQSEQLQIHQLRKDFRLLPDADESVRSEAGSVWNKNLNRLKKYVLEMDPRAFLRWDVVRETMFVGNADYINYELAYLKKNKEWLDRWEAAINETEHGCPAPFYNYKKSSGNLIHHAYHLARFEEETGIRINKLKNIFEFGGGYGSMCRLVHRLGFKGKYVIFDLPHFSTLQRYYLSGLGLQLNADDQICGSAGISCVDNADDLTKLRVGGDDSLFIATWSFSESPIAVRQKVIKEVGFCQAHLIGYQDVFGEVDNVDYFSGHASFGSFQNMMHEKIEHLPGSRYLFGWGDN